MGRLKCVEDYLVHGLGYTAEHCRSVLHYRDVELKESITFPWLKDKMEDLRLSLEARLFLENNPPQIEYEPTELQEHSNSSGLSVATRTTDSNKSETEHDKDYGLPPSTKETCQLFWFQKKHAKEILDKLTIDQLRTVLLVAQAGTGKTFILGAIIRRLLDMGWHKKHSIAPWPFCYVTKASVVEQTRRVLEQSFGIDTNAECIVTNYDQLRSRFGEMFITEKTIVTNGIEEIVFVWKPKIHPCVFILDECQSAKNESSTQAKIVYSIAEIKDFVQVICSSATPFTRVSEAKYLVLNCGINKEIY